VSFAFPPAAVVALLLLLVTLAAAYDLLLRRIPNWLTGTGILLGLTTNTWLHPIWTGLQFSLAGLSLALVVYMALYALRAMGAGDVKLMAAVGSLAGWENWVAIFLITALIGGVCALILVALRGRIGKTLQNVAFILSEMKGGRPAYIKNEELDVRSSKALRQPHGAMIAAGTALFLGLAARYQ
jgi:prepilin peptidase CpaA